MEPDDPGGGSAILAADVVDYARLLASDEQATVAALYAYRGLVTERVEAHGGRILDLSGDKVLAELPDAVAGARCALSIQREVDRRNQSVAFDRIMSFRMAVHVPQADGDGFDD